MTSISDLQCCGLIEKDSNGDVLWTWAYPSISDELRNISLRKCGLHNDSGVGKHHVPFIYGHYQRSWYYLNTTEVFEADNLSRVKQFVLVLWTRDFNPEKYKTLCRILSKTYCKVGTPTSIVQLYLSVVTRGSCSTEENGTFLIRDFEQKRSFANAGIKGVINMFKLETILIYTALILKKRLVVYHHRLDSLLQFMRVLPTFVWHRQNWNVLYPYVDLNAAEEMADLRSGGPYAAGFVDATVETRNDLYDIFINLAATEITVASHSKDVFAMSKTHKDIALFMVHCAEDNDLNDQQVIKEVSSKTQEIVAHLGTLLRGAPSAQAVGTSAAVPSLANLMDHKLAPALENFLYNLAVAENMVDLQYGQ